MPRLKRLVYLIAILYTYLLMNPAPETARASEVKLEPSLGIYAEYNDNIDFSATREEEDFLTRIRPAVGLTYQAERFSLSGNGAFTLIRYLEEDRRNTEYHDYALQGAYSATERLSLEGRVSYRLDETLESELQETGLFTRREERSRYGAGAGLAYRFTERTDMRVDVDHSGTEYENDDRVDYSSNSLSLTLNRLFRNQRDVVTLKPYYSTYDSDATKVDNYGVYVGWARSLAETWRLSCFLGVRFTQTEYTLVRQSVVFTPFPVIVFRQVQEEDENFGGIADVSITKTGETYSGTLGYNRDLSYSSYGDPIERDRVYVNGSRTLTPRLSLGMSASVYQSESDGVFSQEDSRHLDLGATLNYRLTEKHTLSAGYGYAYHEDDTLSANQEYDRNRAWVSLTYRFPRTY